MPHVRSCRSKRELLSRAFSESDIYGGGLICEFGVWKAESLNYIAHLTDEKVYGFDSFEGLSEDWADHWRRGDFRVSILPKVRRNVHLVKGRFSDTLPSFLEEHPERVRFIHVDSDLYSSCKTIFELMADRLRPGSVIVFDEFFNYPNWEEGEFKAFQEFITKTSLQFEFLGYNRNSEQVAVKLVEKL